MFKKLQKFLTLLNWTYFRLKQRDFVLLIRKLVLYSDKIFVSKHILFFFLRTISGIMFNNVCLNKHTKIIKTNT